MATHTNILAWRVPWREKPGRLQSMVSQRVRHDWNDLHAGNDNNTVVVLNTVKSFSSVQSLSRVRLFATPWMTTRQASLSITNSRNLLKLMSVESVMPSNHLILCHPLFLLPSIFPSIKVFSNDLAVLIRWPKYWRFSFSISSSIEYSGLTFFRVERFDLLVVQEALKSLLQHYISKASILWHSAFFMV